MVNQQNPLNLIICGVGGQGNILLSRMIGRIFTAKGYFVTIGETFGAAQRGGSVYSSMRISKAKHYGPLIPEGKAHLILSLEPLEALRLLRSFGNSKTYTITNVQAVYPVGVLAKRFRYPALDQLKASINKLSQRAWFLDATGAALSLESPIIANIVMMGGLTGSGIIPLSNEEVEQEIRESFPPSKVDLNLSALKIGIGAVSQ